MKKNINIFFRVFIYGFSKITAVNIGVSLSAGGLEASGTETENNEKIEMMLLAQLATVLYF